LHWFRKLPQIWRLGLKNETLPLRSSRKGQVLGVQSTTKAHWHNKGSRVLKRPQEGKRDLQNVTSTLRVLREKDRSFAR
jgi:hypothetical protein